VAIWSSLIVLPLKWLELDVISRAVLFAKLLMGFNFGVSAASVLERGEDCGWDTNVVHLLGLASVESLSEELTSLDGHWGQLKLAVDDITNGVDVWHVGLFNIVDLELAILLSDETGVSKIESSGKSISGRR
jgi:hypothetical protein